MPPKRAATDDLASVRLKSRQQYLEKRNALKLVELQKQVQEEEEEERQNPSLSKSELARFARNRELLRIIIAREQIDDSNTGFTFETPTDKTELLNERPSGVVSLRGGHNAPVSEFSQWEEEQLKKTIGKPQPGVTQFENQPLKDEQWEYVFDPSVNVRFTEDIKQVYPKKLELQKKLDAAETKATSIQNQRASLPVSKYKDKLIQAISEHQVIILVGETGSGKTTQLPQFILELMESKGDDKMVVCTQPRRVPAMSVAKRVAEEYGSRLGQEVGYSVRFDDRTSEKTRIKYATDGILLQELKSDPALEKYTALIIDEAHERTCNTDLLLALAKDLVHARSDFRLIISSATMNAEVFSKYFNDAPIFNVPGRMFRTKICYTTSAEADFLAATIISVMQIHASQPILPNSGDILAFLPGEAEITAAQEAIEEICRKCGSRIHELRVLPLFSSLSSELQAKVFEPRPPKARKVILSTNIAETSVTIDGISFVLDCGYEKQAQYNEKTGLSSLVVTPISRASANQRAGRAGRVSDGVCLRLYQEMAYYSELPETTPPEIQRVALAPVVLTLKSLGINDILNFDWLDPPSPDAMIASLEELYALGAISSTGELSIVGRRMATLPLTPKQSRMILEADKLGATNEILIISAMLTESGALFLRPKDKKLHADAARRQFISREGGDHGTLLNVYQEFEASGYDPAWTRSSFLNYRSLVRVREIYDQLVNLCDRVEIQPSSAGTDHVAIRQAVTAGYFMHLARLQRDGISYRTVRNGLTVWIHPSSIYSSPEIQRPKWVIYDELVLTSKEYMRNVVEIDPSWLGDVASHYFKKGEIEKLGVDKKLGKGKGKVGVDGR